jgi:hypothetical protein
MLLIATAVLPVASTLKINENKDELNIDKSSYLPRNNKFTLFPQWLLKLINGDWNYWENEPHMFSLIEGNVGIGTSNPASKLEVVGNIEADGFTINGVPLGSSTDSYWSKSEENIYYNIGNVGIGTTNPNTNLDINGQIRIRGGNPGNGKVLTSDLEGIASWITPTIIPPNYVMPRTGGIDTLLFTVYDTISIAGIGTDIIELKGTFSVLRQPPSSTDWVSGTMEVEMIDLDLVGHSSILGNVRATLNPGYPTFGFVDIAESGNSTKACSFNAYIQLELLQIGKTVFNKEPVPLRHEITHIPPIGEGGGTHGEVDIKLYDISNPDNPSLATIIEVVTDIGEFAHLPTFSDGDWIVSQGNMYSAVSGNIGIGVTNPENMLHVKGAINFDPVSEPTCPTTGFIIFCDNEDGILKAKSSSGEVTILAYP